MKTALDLTIPQLSYQLVHRSVLRWLLGLNPRGLRVPLRLVAHYMAGLLWVCGTATCVAMAAATAVSHDALRRLLIGLPLGGLLQMVALTMVNREIGWLVLDDNVQDKTGPMIEGIAWLHSSTIGKRVLALNPVVMGWTDGEIFVPLAFRFWKPPMSRDKKRKPSELAFDGTPFRTKIELAIDLLRWAHQRGFKPQAVLFDAYYATAKVFKFLKRVGWAWVTRIKANRKLKRGGTTFRPRDWPKLVKAGKCHRRLTTSIVAALPGWGDIRVIAVRRSTDKEYRYLAGSNPKWTRAVIERWYGYRWPIECLFRDSSQTLGLHDCQSRSFRAQENHTALVFLAYLFLRRQARPKETIGEAKMRLQAHPASALDSLWPPGVRQVTQRRRRRKAKPDHSGISAKLA